MTDRILARLGEDAVLRGDTPCRVNVEHGVEVTQGDMVYNRTVATMAKATLAKSGDSLVFVDAEGTPLPGQAYVIDSPAFQDNGYTVRHVLRSA
ncbi:hypothetical protein [Cupriavidus necator]